jgi:hypothetical protein
MAEVWLRQNSRAIVFGMLPPGLLTLAIGVWILGLATPAPTGWWRIAGWIGLSFGCLLLAVLTVQLRQPRIAYREPFLLLNLRAGQPIAVPIEVVEAFLLGMGPAMLPGRSEDRTETRTLSIRLAERAEEWAQIDVKPALAKWCGGYITIRGTWCEPLSVPLVNQLNARLAEAHAAARLRTQQVAT